jgi:hypothetical protein
VQSRIFADFLFREFLETYKKTFLFRNYHASCQPAFFSWNDHSYNIFMNDILSNLEPRQERHLTEIWGELDEVNEVIFFIKGCVDVGFEFNRIQDYVLRLDKCYIGAYSLTYNKRSDFVYRTFGLC